MKFSKIALIATGFAVAFSMMSVTAEAQKRGNKGGEMRGKERASQVKEMKEERKHGMEQKTKDKKPKRSKKPKK